MTDKNVALIGLPGCGKSTAGRMLADRLGFAFIDTDAEIEAAAGMTIGEIFGRHGEDYFRGLETAAIRKVAARTRAVIAAGGGAVLREENMSALRERCVIVYLKRDCGDILRSSGLTERPLLASDPRRIYALYEERRPLYEKYADITADGEDGSDETAQTIVRELERL